MDKYFEIENRNEQGITFKGTVAAFNALVNNTEKLLNQVMTQANLEQNDFFMTNPTFSFNIDKPETFDIRVSLSQIVFPNNQLNEYTFNLSPYFYFTLRNNLHEAEAQLKDIDNNAFNIMVHVTLENVDGAPHLNVNYDYKAEEKDLTFYPYRLVDNSEVYSN